MAGKIILPILGILIGIAIGYWIGIWAYKNDTCAKKKNISGSGKNLS